MLWKNPYLADARMLCLYSVVIVCVYCNIISRVYGNVVLGFHLQLHRTSMVIACLLNTIAFVIIFVEVGGYSEVSSKPFLKVHVCLLCC